MIWFGLELLLKFLLLLGGEKCSLPDSQMSFRKRWRVCGGMIAEGTEVIYR